ncbi:MAG: DNA recombination protein RmuC [Sulfurospirillum sp.]
MEINIINFVMLLLPILVIFTLVWFGFTIRNKSKDELLQSIKQLQDEKNEMSDALEIQKKMVSQRDILIAQKQKDLDNILSAKANLEENYMQILQQYEKQKGDNNDLQMQNHSLVINLKALEEDIKKSKQDYEKWLKEKSLSLNEANAKIENMHDEIYSLKEENSRHKAQLEAQLEGNKKLKADLEEQGRKLELKINEIMQNLLDTKMKKFDDSSMKSLKNLLKPFKDNLEEFKHKVEYSQEHSTKKFAELSKEIEQITKMSVDIGKEARSLTEALKGKKQTQGRWGEMILESVLEFSGLIKGKHYETQESYRDEQGATKRPDVVVKLPQERTIIIDSKVSLNDYDSYIKADSDKQRHICAKAVVNSFKNHINTLDSKDYSQYKTGTLQYIFMFVPIEGAFALAVQEDQSLYEYALDRHIAIVTPSTLTVSLRTIYLYWQSEQSSSNALKMFNVAGKLYDKMLIFAESFGKLGNQIQTVNNTYESAKTQFASGSGNLMKRTETLKALGAKTTKSLRNSKVAYSDFDDEEAEVELLEGKE